MTTPSCHQTALRGAEAGSPTIAVVGAPNSGKSTLFNALTGARVQMGNWPGTSVDIARGAWRVDGREFDIIDLPGAYSLSADSPDEAFTRQMLIDCAPGDEPDAIVVVLDASNIARALYMVAELRAQRAPLVIALTKQDVARAHGIIVDAPALERAIGSPVVEVNPRRPGADIAALARTIVSSVGAPTTPALIDDDPFTWIAQVMDAAVREEPTPPTLTERLDKVVLHRFAGPVLFLAVMWVVFQITTTVAAPLQDGLDWLISGPVSSLAHAALGWAPTWVDAFVVNGLLAGVGTVLTFVPLMALMFICLAVLEDTGYMARAAVITDRLMRTIGLPGKAFIPLIVGFGCNVPAIAATRVLSRREHRILTALLVPLTSCTARLAVYVMLATTFFPRTAGTVVFAMYVISIAFVVVLGFALRHTVWRDMGTEPLIIDLPDYQVPGLRLVASSMWVRLRGFLRTAGGIIVACVVAVFILQSTPVVPGTAFADDTLTIEDSAYGTVAGAVAPVFEPAGFGSWSLTGPLITGFLAKEAVVSTWAQTYALDSETDTTELSQALLEDFTQTSGGHPTAAVWAFLIFLLAYTPCVATLAAQKREIGWRWTLIGLGLQLAVAWVAAVAVFQVLAAVL